MAWSIKLGRIFGIDIKMHLTFLLILVLGAYSYGGSAGPLYGVVIVLALFSLVLLHELGHSLAALWYGISVKDIVLLPIGGVARLERMPENPGQELVVALAGPAVNVVLALGLAPLVFLFGGAQTSLLPQIGSNLLNFLLSANISLAVFNMLPIFPMDGGRVFRAILGYFTTYQRATKIAVRVGRALAIVLGIAGYMYTGSIWLAIIALFMFTAGGQEGQAVAIRGLLRRVQAGQVMSKNTVALSQDATVGQLAPMVMRSGQQANYAILDPVDGQLLGVTSGRRITQALVQGRRHADITEIMQQAQHVPTVALHTTLDEVQEKLEKTSNRVAAVYDGLNFRGLITAEDIFQTFQYLSRQGTAQQQIA